VGFKLQMKIDITAKIVIVLTYLSPSFVYKGIISHYQCLQNYSTVWYTIEQISWIEGDKYVRTITILAVMSIFICSLNQFFYDYQVTCGNQECFRKEYRTACADNLFVINKLFSLLIDEIISRVFIIFQMLSCLFKFVYKQ
jgi:hypothetical protein